MQEDLPVMRLETLPDRRDIAGALSRVPDAWRAPLLQLGACWLLLIALLWSDWSDMAGQWWNSSTFNHILLVPPILGWLAWQRAPQLARLRPGGWWPGLLLCAGALAVWLLGAFSGLSIARQFGAVTLLIGSALTLLGPKVGAGLAFPLGYMLLLVPFGDELVPALQMLTADITIALVTASGIPAVIEGVFIDTPAGLFEVAEACSGVKFLIAMIAFGLLVANVCFLSWPRRVLFLVACMVVPILANGVRAWATVYAAQIFGIEAAAGFDHIVYGWVFFAIVLAIVLAASWRFFDRPIEDPMIDAQAIARSPVFDRLAGLRIRPLHAVAVLVAMVAAILLWARAADALAADLPQRIALPQVEGWTRVDYEPTVWWEPRATGADHRLLGRYRDATGREVDVFVALYASQGEGREAGGFGEGALMPESDWAWLAAGPGVEHGKSEQLLAFGRTGRLAQTHYRTGDMTTGSNVRLKLNVMADRLLLKEKPTTMLILSTEEKSGYPAGEALRSFRSAMGPLDEWMDRVAGLR